MCELLTHIKQYSCNNEIVFVRCESLPTFVYKNNLVKFLSYIQYNASEDKKLVKKHANVIGSQDTMRKWNIIDFVKFYDQS